MLHKRRVLLAGAYAPFRREVRQIFLNQPDVELIGEVENGGQAIDSVQELKPDILLIDVSLPDMSGLDVTSLITRNTPATEVIVLTDDNDEEYRVAAEVSGARALVTKLSAHKDLLPLVRKLGDIVDESGPGAGHTE